MQVLNGNIKKGHIKVLLLRRNIDYFGDAFGELRLPQRFLLRRRNRRGCNRRIQMIWFVYCGVFYCDVTIEIARRHNRRIQMIWFIYCGLSIAAPPPPIDESNHLDSSIAARLLRLVYCGAPSPLKFLYFFLYVCVYYHKTAAVW